MDPIEELQQGIKDLRAAVQVVDATLEAFEGIVTRVMQRYSSAMVPGDQEKQPAASRPGPKKPVSKPLSNPTRKTEQDQPLKSIFKEADLNKLHWKENRYGEWIFSEDEPHLRDALEEQPDHKLRIGEYNYRVSGDELQFINRSKGKGGNLK